MVRFFMSLNGEPPEVPAKFSGESLLNLLSFKKSKEANVTRVRGDGNVGTIPLPEGVQGVYRGRNKNSGNVRQGEVDYSLVGQRPRRPENVREENTNN